MMDSGASINAGWAKKHFPGSVARTSASQLKGEFANTANGDRLYNEGEFDITGECDGVSMSIGFTNMKKRHSSSFHQDVLQVGPRRFIL